MTGWAPRLLRWFDAHRRDLPWRRKRSAYATLVSESMAQQTVIAAVVPHFERFMNRFPTVAALAEAPLDDVLAAWSGLGYYRRARHLHAAARAMLAEHGGRVPEDEETLRLLPGVGPYTAAAVAAIAYERRAFPLDGNAARVLARLGNVNDLIDAPDARRRLHAMGLAALPTKRRGDFVQAVMELGALVCSPRAPRCDACPVRAACAGRAAGHAADLPRRAPKRPRKLRRWACALVARRGRVLLVRRPDDAVFGGTYMPPAVEVPRGQAPVEAARAAARSAGVAASAPPRALGEVRHVLTHRDLRAHVFELRGRATGRPDTRWLSRDELAGVGLSTFARKMVDLMAWER